MAAGLQLSHSDWPISSGWWERGRPCAGLCQGPASPSAPQLNNSAMISPVTCIPGDLCLLLEAGEEGSKQHVGINLAPLQGSSSTLALPGPHLACFLSAQLESSMARIFQRPLTFSPEELPFNMESSPGSFMEKVWDPLGSQECRHTHAHI